MRVLVHPRSKSRTFIADIDDGQIVLNVRSPPHGGKANAELLKRLAKTLGVSTASLRVVSGLGDREKVIEVVGVSAQYVTRALKSSFRKRKRANNV